MTSLKTSIKPITYFSAIGCLEIQGASLPITYPAIAGQDIDLVANLKHRTFKNDISNQGNTDLAFVG
ncbi:hypothetical protein GLP02_23680, partial [Escherichia coli]|nr:hypothetical protein [Escherichia coli]